MYRTIAAAAALMVSSPASAEVVTSSANGFQVRHVVDLPIDAGAALTAFGEVGGWWNAQHTYSGDASNLTLKLVPGGCFCETIAPGGGIEHMRVAYVDPGKRIVLTGSLGPLLYEATAGVMDVQVKPVSGGSQFILDYRAAGFFKGGADKLAPLVDQVLAEQVKRYGAYAGKPRS